MRIYIESPDGERLWSFGDGHGETSLSFLHDGTQERIIWLLERALLEDQGQLSRQLQEANIIAYVRRTPGKV
jgi:hypothetical protein